MSPLNSNLHSQYYMLEGNSLHNKMKMLTLSYKKMCIHYFVRFVVYYLFLWFIGRFFVLYSMIVKKLDSNPNSQL